MTKEEARKSLFNTKVYVDGKSEEIQQKLFKIGFGWTIDPFEVKFTDKPFLCMRKNLIEWESSMNAFKDDNKREVSASYILNLKWDDGFKDGDILSYSNNPLCVFIYRSGGTASDFYCGITSNGMYYQYTLNTTCGMNGNEDKELLVLANEEQKSLLFNEMKKHNKQWNDETKQIEKWSINLSPFDRVLGRDTNEGEWIPDFFQKYSPEVGTNYPYYCIGDCYAQCIPYEGNEDKIK